MFSYELSSMIHYLCYIVILHYCVGVSTHLNSRDAFTPKEKLNLIPNMPLQAQLLIALLDSVRNLSLL